MHVRRVKHIAVATTQLEQMKSLFGEALGLPLRHEARFESGTRMAMFDLGNLELELLQNPVPQSLPGRFIAAHGPGYYHVCLEVDDLPLALAELAAKGVRPLEGAPKKGADGGQVVFLDPETTGGLLIELEQAIDEMATPAATPAAGPTAAA